MHMEHRIIVGNSQRMPELADSSVHLMVTSPPYPMIKMWDDQFAKMDPKIARLWRELEADCREETVTQIYDAMHANLVQVWLEAYRVLIDGGVTCRNVGDATRTGNTLASPRRRTFCGRSPRRNLSTRARARSSAQVFCRPTHT